MFNPRLPFTDARFLFVASALHRLPLASSASSLIPSAVTSAAVIDIIFPSVEERDSRRYNAETERRCGLRPVELYGKFSLLLSFNLFSLPI
jgi:hypothetical protein